MTRLARLLNQRPSFVPSDEIPRRLSWERYVTKPTVGFLKYEGRREGGVKGVGVGATPYRFEDKLKKKKISRGRIEKEKNGT